MRKTSSRIISLIQKYTYVLFGALKLLISVFFIDESRGKLAEAAEFFGWKNPLKSYPLLLPFLDPDRLFPSGVILELDHPVGEDGNVSLLELVIINHLVRLTGAASMFEFGTFNGRTTLNMAANGDKGARVYTLDLEEFEIDQAMKNPEGDIKFTGKVETGTLYKGSPHAAKIVELRGDSAMFDFSAYLNSMDLIFIDGAHTYEYVRSDSEAARNMARSEAVILWHDYRSSCQGVSQALNELWQAGGFFKDLRHIAGTNLAVLFTQGVATVVR